jgi:hypothetical protein
LLPQQWNSTFLHMESVANAQGLPLLAKLERRLRVLPRELMDQNEFEMQSFSGISRQLS